MNGKHCSRMCLTMWMVFVLLAVGLEGCKSSLDAGRPPAVARAPTLRQFVFPSGLRIVAERDATSPVVGVFLLVGAGSSSDPAGKEGLAHLVEHLSFRSRPFGRSSFRRLLERARTAQWNANTLWDATLYEDVGPAVILDDLLRLEATRMLAPVANVPPDVLAAELRIVRSELAARGETGLSGDVLASVQRAVFPAGHAYARPGLGTPASLAAIQEGDIAAFVRGHYRPENMTLAIVGDIDLSTLGRTLDGALPPELIRASSDARHRAPLPELAPEPPNSPPARLARGVGSVAYPEIWIGWSLPRSVDRDIHLAQMVTREADSLLHALDEDVTDVDARLLPGKEASLLAVRVELRRGVHPEKSLERVLARAQEIWNADQWLHPRDADVFPSRKDWALGNLFETENIVRRGKARAITTHFTLNAATYGEGVDKLVALEHPTFADYVRRYLKPERARAVYLATASDGGMADARPIGKYALGEDDATSLSIDEARLRDLAPGPGAAAYRRLSLPNGLDVVVGRRGGIPMAAVAFSFHGGYANGAQPAAAYVASLLAYGEGTRRLASDGETLPRERFRLDATSYAFEGGVAGIGRMMRVMGRAVRDAKVDPENWAQLRFGTTPEADAHDRFLASLFAGHAYGRLPSPAEMAASKPTSGQQWLDATHIPNNGTLVVVGDVDVSEAEKLARDEFAGWKSDRQAPPMLPAAYAPRSDVQISERPGAIQARLRLGCVLPPARVPADQVRHEVVAHVVEARTSEVIHGRTGEVHDLVANAHALRGGTSYLDVSVAVERSKLDPALRALREVLHDLGEAPISDNELAWAKLRTAASRTMAYGTNGSVASAVMEVANLGFPLESLDHAAQHIAAVTTKDVQSDVRACWRE